MRQLTSPYLSFRQEEKKVKAEKDAIIAAAKKRGAEKAKLTKSLIIMDVKPWDDTTGLPSGSHFSKSTIRAEFVCALQVHAGMGPCLPGSQPFWHEVPGPQKRAGISRPIFPFCVDTVCRKRVSCSAPVLIIPSVGDHT